MSAGREGRLTAAGHPAVTGRHDKTLELTAEGTITARATCVLGVGAGPLPGELPLLRDRYTCGWPPAPAAATVEGEVNPHYASGQRLVVRRGDQLDPDTFLVNASAAAADLDPGLLDRLRDPAARLEVTATELATPAPVLLVLLAGGGDPGPGPRRLAAQADLVVDLTARGAPAPAVELTAPRRHGVPTGLAGLRTVVVLADGLGQLDPATRAGAALAAGLPGAQVLVRPPTPGADLLLAAGVPAAPVLHAGPLPAGVADRRELARLAGATPVPAVLDVPAALLPPAAARPGDRLAAAARPGDGLAAAALASALAGVRELLPAYAVLLPDPAVGWGVGALRLPAGAAVDPADLRGLRHAPRLVLLPPAGRAPALSVDPGELARALRAAGSSGRDAAAVLTLLGVARREAYRLAAEQS